MTEISSKKYLTGFHLKIIAVVTMLIDHVGAAVLEQIMVSGNEMILRNYETIIFWDKILRSIGRTAFPLYCFLLVEGFIHTRNRKKYMICMGIFALISEIPFDMAFFDKVIYMTYQNVFFTLLLGLLTMQAIEYMQKRSFVWGLLPAIAGILLADVIACDYAGSGILLIIIFYYFREHRLNQCVWGVLCAVFVLEEIWALPAFLLLFLYNGERGQKMNKYIFYAFYPLHLCVLFALRYVLVATL